MSVLNEFVKALQEFRTEVQQWEEEEKNLEALSSEFEEKFGALMNALRRETHLTRGNEAFELCETIYSGVHEALKKHQSLWQANWPVRKLARNYDDRVILLIYGKVNSGKSTLINFLAQQLSEALGSPSFFQFEEGELRYIEGPLKSGVTETTQQIQGVELGKNLVFLDTPGLHSVTGKNEALARRFTEAGDAILWLTHSASPGQVQELEALTAELEKGRPLIPVITASDRLEEDIDADGEIVRSRQNKPSKDRQAQEEDVHARACEKLGSALFMHLRRPISISVAACQAHGLTPVAFEESGIHRLLIAMSQIVQEARESKSRKARSQIAIHLTEYVIKPLKETIVPQLEQIQQETRQMRQALKTDADRLEKLLTANLKAQVLTIIERHVADRDVSKIIQETNQLMTELAHKYICEELMSYAEKIDALLDGMMPVLDEDSIGAFKEKYLEVPQRRGAAAKMGITAAGGIAGMAVGAVFGPLGSFIGSLVGSFIGNKLGSLAEEQRVERILNGIDSSEVEKRATAWVDEQSHRIIQTICSSLDREFASVASMTEKMRECIEDFEKSVMKLKQ